MHTMYKPPLKPSHYTSHGAMRGAVRREVLPSSAQPEGHCQRPVNNPEAGQADPRYTRDYVFKTGKLIASGILKSTSVDVSEN